MVYLGGVDCEDCGYLVPSAEQFGAKWIGIPRTSMDYSEMRCPLCGGRVGADAFSKKHPEQFPGHYNYGELEDRRRAKLPALDYTKGRIMGSSLITLLAELNLIGESDKPG